MVLQIANDIEQDGRFLLGEGGRWLIEDQQPYLFVQRLGDFNQLLLPEAKITDARIRGNRETYLGQQFSQRSVMVS